MLIEKISNEEISMIDNYRRDYAYDGTCSEEKSNYFMPTKELLQVWENAKSEYLNKIFKNNLTLTKHLNFSKSFEELSSEIDDMIDGNITFGRFNRSGYLFIDEFLHLIRHSDEKLQGVFDKNYRESANELMNLVYTETLVNNRYTGNDVDIPLPNGKIYKVRSGCKPMRALSKIAEIFDLNGFEDFRICHSQILNQKDIGGDLTLSIHPLDYITMSDNNCGWDSCMSWSNSGGYRQGTVEMMNSKCVIVAYLSAEEPMSVYPYTWTNKKWRQLFIVDKNAILGVKGYPYQNHNLTSAVLEWLRELVENNLGWTYGDIIKINSYDDNAIILPHGERVRIKLQTNYMYNDWGCLKEHCVMFNPNILTNDLIYRGFVDNYIYSIEYSGNSQCMICGDIDVSLTDESSLICPHCQNALICDCCGDYIYHDNYYYIDNMTICDYCYKNYVHECASCNEEHYDDNMREFYIIPHWTAEEQKILREKIIEEEKKSCLKSLDESWYDMPEVVSINIGYPQFTICDDKSCLNSFYEEYLKDGSRPSFWKIQGGYYTCIYWDDLTEQGKERLYYSNSTFKENAFKGYNRFKARFAQKIKDI